MTSNRQVSANQRNSLRSTGPNTDEGKIIVAQNALKHGILSAKVPIDEQEREEFNSFASYFKAYLIPNGPLEEMLCDRITSTLWRLRRIVHIESLVLEKAINNDWKNGTYEEVFEGFSATVHKVEVKPLAALAVYLNLWTLVLRLSCLKLMLI